MKSLGCRLRSAPMFVALIPFVAGVAASEYIYIPMWVVVLSLFLCIAMTYITDFSQHALAYIALALMLGGYGVARLRAPVTEIPYDTAVEMVVDVCVTPQQRDGYRVAEGCIRRWRDGDVWSRADDKVLLWIRCDSVTCVERLVIVGQLRERISRHDEYNRLMHHRGYVGGISIDNYNLLGVESYAATTLHATALSKLAGHYHTPAAHSVVEAMVTGERSNIPSDVRSDYARTGMSHLMAVSGLHLGIVMLVVNLLLTPLLFIHRGHIVRSMLVVVVLWLFVVVTGGSASAIRAAVMLTVVQMAMMTSMPYVSINVLSVTIFAMLLYRPDYLYDISFQLSVTAVMGILLWGVPAIRELSLTGVGRSVASTLIIGVVASLWTLPIVSHTFANIPLIGVVVTPIALLVAYIIVGCGIVALVLPMWCATIFIAVAEYGAVVQNMLVHGASLLPFAAVEYRLGVLGVAICYTLFMLITAIVWAVDREKKITLPEYDDYI